MQPKTDSIAQDKRAAEKYRLLQAAAIIKMYQEGRLAELDDLPRPIDPRTAFSHKELIAQMEAIEARFSE